MVAVVKGSNGSCSPEYLCSAEKQEAGYDGPIGLGTPNGLPSPPPGVASVAPGAGAPAGGTAVTITGANFEEVVAVRFGASAAKSFTVVSPTSITALSPAGSGMVDVTVETTAGASQASALDRYTYFAPHYALEIPPTALGGTPSALATNAEGDVWVAELGSPALKEFSEAGALIRQLPATLESPCKGSRSESAGVATDTKGDLWVTDRTNGRVLEFTPEGRCALEFGSVGAGPGQFKTPQGIAVGPGGNVWVLDAGNARVEEFSGAGQFIHQFSVDSPSGANAWGIAVDASGHVWVSVMAALDGAVQEWSESGALIAAIRSPAATAQVFEWATGLALTPSGQLLVAHWLPDRLELLGEAGEALASFGSCCSGEGHFGWPIGVASDSKGNVWIAEARFGRVEKWAPGP